MGTRYHIGATSLRGAITAYAKRFDLLEVPLSSGVKGPAPTLATLRKWRKSVPPHFEFAVVAGQHIARAKPGAELDAELEEARATIAALQARCFVVRTPADVTPSQASRDRLRKVFAEFPQDATHVVWEPGGLWRSATPPRRLASGGSPSPSTPRAIRSRQRRLRTSGFERSARLGRTGRPRSSGSSAPSARGATRTSFSIPIRPSPNAKRSAASPRAHCSTTKGGGWGRLVRPRGGIVVRDDEQE